MSGGSLARRYAKAVLQLAEEQGNLERIGTELRGLSEAMEASEEFRATLSNPVFPRADRELVLTAVLGRLGASATVKHLALLLLDRERMAFVPGISRELDTMIDEKIGRVSAEVISARRLTPAHENKIREQLERLSGKKVELTTAEDPELLGGIVARVGDIVFDASLRTQLQQIRETLAD